MGSIPGSGRFPREGNSLQYSCLENPTDRGAWWATVHGVTKESNTTGWLNNSNLLDWLYRIIIPYDYTVEVRNRFKGLDLIDRVLDELWREVRDTVQETGIKTIPKKKKCKKAKWLSEEALQIAEKWREVRGKGEKEKYIHLNAEFQRIARRDKKAILSDQCKEIEENNIIGKTRGLFKKTRYTKGTFH